MPFHDSMKLLPESIVDGGPATEPVDETGVDETGMDMGVIG